MSKQQRSPACPQHDLEMAVGYVRKIYDADGRSEVGKEAVLENMGFSGVSGASASALASLRHFGLIEGRVDKYRITDLAYDILHAPPPRSGEALKEAALQPSIFREIWEKENGRLPSDAGLRYYLEKTRGFKKNAVEGVIKNLRATVDYAGLTPGAGTDGGSEQRQQNNPPVTPLKEEKGPFGVIRNLDIPMENGGVAVFPVPMTKADYTLLTSILSSLKNIHVKEPPPVPDTDGKNEE